MSMQAPWPEGPLQPSVAENEVHLWCASPERTGIEQETLAIEELARAERFRFARDRDHFLARRAWLRRLLARYGQTSPGSLSFTTGRWGKPALTAATPRLFFNLTHSGDLLLCGVTHSGEVGVDVEQLDARALEGGETPGVLAAGERRLLENLAPAAQVPAFIALWTVKEACIKADGRGVSAGLENFDLSALWTSLIQPPEVAGPVRLQGWWISRFCPATSFTGAVATAFRHRLRCFSGMNV